MLTQMCEAAGCQRRANFGDGNVSQPLPRWCSVHADRSQSVDLSHPRCRVQGCQKHPSFGPLPPPGSLLPAERLYCSKHKTRESINLQLWSRKRGKLSEARRGSEARAVLRAKARAARRDAALRAKARAALDLSDTDSTSSLPVAHASGSGSDAKASSSVGSKPRVSRGSGCYVRSGAAGQSNHSAVTRWLRYCDEVAPAHGSSPLCPLPASQETVLGFIDYLQHEEKVSCDTLRVYLAVINKLHQDGGYERPARGPRICSAKKAFAAARLNSFTNSARLVRKDGASGSLLKGDSSLSRDSHEMAAINLLHVDLGCPMPAGFAGVEHWDARQEEVLLSSPQPNAATRPAIPLSPLVLASSQRAPVTPQEVGASAPPTSAAAPAAPILEETSMCSANNEEDGRATPCVSWAAQVSGSSPPPFTPIPPPMVPPVAW